MRRRRIRDPHRHRQLIAARRGRHHHPRSAAAVASVEPRHRPHDVRPGEVALRDAVRFPHRHRHRLRRRRSAPAARSRCLPAPSPPPGGRRGCRSAPRPPAPAAGRPRRRRRRPPRSARRRRSRRCRGRAAAGPAAPRGVRGPLVLDRPRPAPRPPPRRRRRGGRPGRCARPNAITARRRTSRHRYDGPLRLPPGMPPGEVAQLVEHTTENRGVAGSNPALAIRVCASRGTPGREDRACDTRRVDRGDPIDPTAVSAGEALGVVLAGGTWPPARRGEVDGRSGRAAADRLSARRARRGRAGDDRGRQAHVGAARPRLPPRSSSSRTSRPIRLPGSSPPFATPADPSSSSAATSRSCRRSCSASLPTRPAAGGPGARWRAAAAGRPLDAGAAASARGRARPRGAAAPHRRGARPAPSRRCRAHPVRRPRPDLPERQRRGRPPRRRARDRDGYPGRCRPAHK